MKILFFSHTVAGGTFRVGSHHLATQFARTGHDVLHVSSPALVEKLISRHPDERIAQARQGPVRDSDGVLQWVPRVAFPMRIAPPGAPLLHRLGTLGFSNPDLVLIDQPWFAPLLRRLDARRVVYRPTDIYRPQAARIQASALASADAVVATSQAVLDSLSLGQEVPSLVLPNGVDTDVFKPTDEPAKIGFVYVGAIDHRFDWDAVVELATQLPLEPVRLFGPVSVAVPTLPTNVAIDGPIAYTDVPAALCRYRVGLLPLNDEPTNRGRSPMKLYEYLACGLSVLARETPGIRGIPRVHGYVDHAGITAAAQAALADDADVAEIVAENSWTRKADELLRFVAQLTTKSSSGQ